LTPVARPTLVVIAGPNGSGKTTLTNRLRATGLDFGEYINADEIALELPDDGQRDTQAQQLANLRRENCLRQRRSFSFETVMSHRSKIDEMRAAKAAGYSLMFIGVALQQPELNVRRVALRVSEGGHNVPTDRIIARYHRTLALMPEAIALSDRALLFDNSDSEAGPQLCFSAIRSGAGKLASPLTIRLASTIDRQPEHWVMPIVAKLKQMRDAGELKLHFGLVLS
jgi:predicted ABC-type ATPase